MHSHLPGHSDNALDLYHLPAVGVFYSSVGSDLRMGIIFVFKSILCQKAALVAP